MDGEYQQLNANILQIENEYYSTVRPKQLLMGNEKPTLALKKRGIRYVELRSLDVNAFDPLGINETQVRFLEVFMLFCLLHESQTFAADEHAAIDQNELLTAHIGRSGDCRLTSSGQQRPLQVWAKELCDQMQAVAELLDSTKQENVYGQALARQLERIKDPEATPSARMLRTMRENGEGFFDFALRMSKQHQEYFRQIELKPEDLRRYQEWTKNSFVKQSDIEAQNNQSFAEYLAEYFAQK